MFNSDTSWEYGAFNINQTGGFDYGWGVYNLQTHHVIGDSLYLINTVNDNWKKLWIKSKISGDYEIKYANLDGSNEVETTVLASNYTNKNFIYYSLDDDLIIDREPDKNDWDITFTKYKTFYPFQGGFMPYSVTGTLHNAGLEVAQADNILNPLSYNNHNSHSFSNSINTIGFDWKEFNGANYSIINNQCYFIRDKSNNIWRITFTGFDGMSTGNIEFNTELIQSTDIENINSSSNFAVYPNPVSRNQQVKIIYDVSIYNTTATIRIHDMFGKEVYLSKMYKDGLMLHSINTQNLKKGIYMLSINIDGMQKTERLVIN